ncbi:MAG: cytochrome d ubiquinol oxidase subunit II [Actinobacteria bacterium]|nr:cytochrome d ubiquinol oxidase subunit II [Actinomycetota bacterium]
MSIAELTLVIMWIGLNAYALFGGADFGGGFWDLVAGGAKRGAPQRKLIENSIGPVWEANHVWLIFCLVVLWTGFPKVFSAVTSSLYVPLTLAAFGIILRGSAFAFRKSVEEIELKRIFGATFAFSSVLTPFFLGTVAGAVASGRVPAGNAQAHPVSSWINPTSVLGGTLAVGICAYLAAVYLTADARRTGSEEVAEGFRTRALWTGVVVGVVALAGIGVLANDAERLFDGLTGRALPLVVASGIGGLSSIVLVWRRRYVEARIAAAVAVSAILWGWAVGQYPYMLEGAVTIEEAAAPDVTLKAMIVSLSVGAVLLIPSLAWMYFLFQRDRSET